MKPILFFSILIVLLTQIANSSGDSTTLEKATIAERAIKEVFDKHPIEMKNFGPFLEEFYRTIPKQTAPLEEEIPAEEKTNINQFENDEEAANILIETVLDDIDDNEFMLK